MNWRIVFSAVGTVVVVALLIVLFSPDTTTPVAETVAPSGRTVGNGVLVTSQFFSPATMTVAYGDALMLEFTSIGMTRTISIPGLGMTQTLTADQKTLVTTPPLGRGEFVVHCTAGCDPGVSMTVTIA